jgi:hypothetical protein
MPCGCVGSPTLYYLARHTLPCSAGQACMVLLLHVSVRSCTTWFCGHPAGSRLPRYVPASRCRFASWPRMAPKGSDWQAANLMLPTPAPPARCGVPAQITTGRVHGIPGRGGATHPRYAPQCIYLCKSLFAHEPSPCRDIRVVTMPPSGRPSPNRCSVLSTLRAQCIPILPGPLPPVVAPAAKLGAPLLEILQNIPGA